MRATGRLLRRQIGRLVRRFAEDKRGAALVEFALILPAMLGLYVGAVEVSSLITIDRRVNIVSSTVGDLVARWDPRNPAQPSLPTSDLTDYFEASEGIVFPYDILPLNQRVSVIFVPTTGTPRVEWSCSYGPAGGLAEGYAANSDYEALPTNMATLARGSVAQRIVVSESSYEYSPVIQVFNGLADAYNLTSASFYLPRYERAIPGPDCDP